MVADAAHSEQLASLSRRRSDVRLSALEVIQVEAGRWRQEQQKRLDIRLNQLSETQTEFQRLRWQQQEAGRATKIANGARPARGKRSCNNT